MSKEYAKGFYLSRAWLDISESVRVNKLYTCEKCGEYGYIVHHIEHITPGNINNPDVTLNIDNLILLCGKCHNRIHHGRRGGGTSDGYKFTPDGDLVPE